MSELAGRLTYLGFGVLTGSAAIAGYFGYFRSNFDVTNTLQILIATFTAIAGGMSAYAAHQAATVTKKTHDNAEKLHEIRIACAKSVITETLSIMQDGQYELHKPLVIANIEGFIMSCQVIEFALIEPMDATQHQALWQARATIQQMCATHKELGHLPPDRREWVEGQLVSVLEAFNQDPMD